MARRSISRKKLYEQNFPYKVDIPVPPEGLGRRINEMVAWCKENVAQWESHGRSEGLQDFARFYFMDAKTAEFFATRWGGQIRGVKRSWTAPLQ